MNYFHLVFSVLHLLVPLMWQNKKILFSPGFQVVRGKTVTQRVRSDFFLDAGTNGGPFADIPNCLATDGLFLATMVKGAVEQKTLGFLQRQ